MVNIIKDAATAFKSLNGVICIYKPAGVSIHRVLHTIKTNLCRDLNELPDRPIEQRVEILGATNQPLEVNVVPNYADHPLVCGPRYIQEDFKCRVATYLGLFSSGVLLVGVNEGTSLSYRLHMNRPTRAYKIHGQLGKATDTYFWNGRTMERATHGHVSREKLDKVVATMQAAHQKTMFDMCGLHMESQTTYDLASKGLLRPTNSKLPILYGIRCVNFKSPDFTLEVQSINENEAYFWELIHNLGIQLKTVAHCTGVQCIRHGHFTVDMALLRKHWQLPHIIDNLVLCQDLLKEHPKMLFPESAVLSQ